MSNYKNLPGVNVNVKDGQMLITEDNTSNSMLIIGHANVSPESGIVVPEEATFVPSEDILFQNYGQYVNQGELNPIAAEWKVAKENGISNIYVLGLTGDTEKKRFIELRRNVFNELPDYEFSHIVVTGMYADKDTEEITLVDFPEGEGVTDLSQVEGLDIYHVVEGAPSATVPTSEELGGGLNLTLTLGGTEITASLTQTAGSIYEFAKYAEKELRIAASAKGIDLNIRIDVTDGNAVQIKTSEEVTVSGTIATTNFLILAEHTSKIQGFGNVASMLGEYAEKQTLESGTVIVYIATSPAVTTTKRDIREKVVELTTRNNEVSKHVQVVAGPQVGERMPGSLRTHWMSGVMHYAVLVNSLAVQNAPTNQPLPGISNLRYDLSLRQLDDLTGNKYVTFRSKNNRIIVVDGITTAPDIYAGQDIVHSDFRRLTTLRSTSYMVSAIRSVVDPFIGRPNEFPAYNAMNTAIRGVINTAVERGIIQDAAYSIELGDNLDVAKVDLTILPQFELRKIDVTIGLSLPGGFETMSE